MNFQIGLIVILLIFLFAGVKAIFGRRKDDQGQSDQPIDKDYRAEEASKLLPPPSITKGQAKAIADAIADATDMFWMSNTDENAVYREMRKINTLSDWYAVRKAFGKRVYSEFMNDREVSLEEMLYLDMDSPELEIINDIFAEKGIDVIFEI